MNPEQFLERFSTHLKNVIARGISIASSMHHRVVTPLHLLAALSQEQGAVGAALLQRLGLDTKTILDNFPAQQQTEGQTTTLPELSPHAKQTLERAMLLAYEQKHPHVGTEHLLHGIVNGRNAALTRLLKKKKIERKHILKELDAIFHGTATFPDQAQMQGAAQQLQDMIEQQQDFPQTEGALPPPAKQQRAIDVFTVDLTCDDAQKRIDPVIGREKEIERLIHILCRRNKNNPVLVGEPGVGKTALVEGLAKRIAEGNVPPVLRDKTILALDLTLLIAGTIYRGEFEARIKQLMDELAKETDSILFIDEMHTIIGAGANQGSMDAANILKPALARGQLRCIGATTADEFEKHITTDPALERRFQKIHITEPSVAQTIEMLRGIKKHYEDFHHVSMSDETLVAAAELSAKYIYDTHLPDKAIDLLDEAAASVRVKQKATKADDMRTSVTKKLREVVAKKEAAIAAEQFDKALAWKEKEQLLQNKKDELEKTKGQPNKPRTTVVPSDIVRVLSRRLDIDAAHIAADEHSHLTAVEQTLRKHIYGQHHVIDRIAQTLRQTTLGLETKRRPRASFLFAGPSGVGKTALAKHLATALFHDETALISFNMSEFAEPHSMSKLLGSPAGYIGHKERNRFTDALQKRPHAVVLFDEFDKAHPDVQKLLFQILDDGVLTDSHGKKIHFTNAIVILTTNIGAELYRTAGIGFGMSGKSKRASVADAVTKKLKDELGKPLFARVNAACIFHPLNDETKRLIIKEQLTHLSTSLSATQNMRITPDDTALKQLVKHASTEDAGARDIESTIREMVHTLVTELLTKPKRKSTYTLTHANNTYKLV